VSPSIDSFIDIYVQALHDQTAAVFAGAGLSIPAGLVNWKQLLRSVARDVGLDVDKEEGDLISVAQYHVNEHNGRHRINQALIDEFASRAGETRNHRILSRLPIRTYWTTNYDQLIEQALRSAGKNPDVKITTPNLATTLARRDAIVFKMHGDVTQPDQAVITKDDYESYDSKRHLFSMALQGDLVSKTFLFIGFSFSDPNLSYILSRIRLLLHENKREHFGLLRRVQRKDFKTSREYQYALAKQDLQIKDLKRYGITALLVDSYADFAAVLERVAAKFRMSRVLISGSAKSYAPWTDQEAQELIQETAARLVKEKFGVVSGYGLGVGPYVLNGVLEQLQAQSTQSMDDTLTLRPFPIGIASGAERKKKWTAYRRDMIAKSGIVIFVFGNKDDGTGKIIPADGVKEEFELAVAAGLTVIPVGCTGGMSAVLHKQVMTQYSKYFAKAGYKSELKVLGTKAGAKTVASRIARLVKHVRDRA
jgi:hypothetical protein